MHTDPIDAVVTWVDGNDPNHQAKKMAALRSEQRFSLKVIPGGRNQTRFADSGEIRYCLHSIRRFMPWIRTIHLVTDSQRPGFLDEAACARLGVVLVDHATMFQGFEWALPTFNSRSIETMLHRVPGLASRYVYFNDDIVVLKPCNPQDFFPTEGVALRGDWKPLEKFGPLRMGLSAIANNFAEMVLGKVRSMHVLSEMKAALLAGMTSRFFEASHVPFPVRKATMEDFFNSNAQAMDANIRHKFRHMDQYLPIALAAHLEIANGRYAVSPQQDNLIICFNRDSPASWQEKIESLELDTVRFLCLQGLERAPADARDGITSFLEKRVGPLVGEVEFPG